MTFTNDPNVWIIYALIFLLGLLIGVFLTAGGRRKWKTRYNSEQYEFKVTSINLLEVTKQNCTKQLILDVPTRIINSDFVNFFDKNVKTYPGKTSIKFNILEPKDNLKLSLYTLEKGVTMNDEIVHWLEENQDVDVQVVVA